jgi:peptide/nickel transport system substrate-binding protein
VERHRRTGRVGIRMLAAAVAALAFAVTSLAVAARADDAAKPTLKVGLFAACGNLTPLNGDIVGDVDLAYEPLIERHADGTLRPGLATSWKISKGNKVITLTLRRGVRFADGSLFDAAAVKGWLDYRVTKNNQFNAWFAPMASADVLSKFVLRVTLKSPDPVLATAFSFDYGRVPSPNALAASKADPQNDFLSRHTAGAGPYTLLASQSVPGDHCTYVPNKFYYDKSKIKWSKIVTRQIPDSNAALAAIRTGQINVMNGAAASTAQAAASAGIKVLSSPGNVAELIFLDRNGTIAKPLGDPRVRQALNYAVNRKKISLGLYGPNAVPTDNPNPAIPLKPHYTYSPAKARSLLAAAGYRDGFSFTAFDTGAFAGANSLDPVCQAVAHDLAAVGVKMQITVTASGNEFLAALRSNRYSAWCSTVVPGEPWRFWTSWMKQGSTLADQHGWRDPQVDRLWLKAQRLNEKRGAPLWKELNRRMQTQGHFVPILRPKRFVFVNKSVQGVVVASEGNTYPPSSSMRDWYPTTK